MKMPGPEYIVVNNKSAIIMTTESKDELIRVITVLIKADAEFTVFREVSIEWNDK